MNTIYRVYRRLLLVVVLLVALPATAQTNYYWDAWDPADVDFHTPGHWDPAGVPGSLDGAYFDVSETNRIVLSSAVTNNNLTVQTSIAAAGIDLTFNLGGQTWDLTSTDANTLADSLVVANNRAATVLMTNGTLNVVNFIFGYTTGGHGALILRGTNMLMTSSGGVGWIGRVGTGALYIEEGAQAELEALRMPRFSGYAGSSLVDVSGGSRMDVAGVAQIGALERQATVQYRDQARGYLEIITIDYGSQLIVAGAGTSVTGGLGRVNVNGMMTVRDGARFEHLRTASTPLRITSTETNATLTVESGGTFIAPAAMHVGYFADDTEGTVIVRGTSSRLEVQDLLLASFNELSTNVTGRLMVQTGAVVAVSGSLTLTDSSVERQAFMEIKGSNAVVQTTHAYLGGDAASSYGATFVTVAAEGLLEVDGTLRVWETAELTINGGAVTTDTLDLRAGATLKVTLHTGGTNALVTAGTTATLTDALFDLSLADGFSSQIGETFTIITGATGGQFAGLDAGEILYVDGYAQGFEVSYADSFTLTTIPEPGSLVLLVLALAGTFMLRRRM